MKNDEHEDDDEGTQSEKGYTCLGDALDAMDLGVAVDPINLRDLIRKSMGPFESELSFETEDGRPISIDVPCEKNPGHPTFIPVSRFKPEDIPLRHRTKRFYDTVLSWANLVVRVVVKRVSRNRQEVYSDMKAKFPFSDKRFLGTTRKVRYGSGYVASGFGTNQPYRGQFCPCHLCRDSGQRREFWSLNIATVTHVTYDSSEARDAVFQFFYDSEGENTNVDFMYGVDSFEQHGKNSEKICIVRCVTHDVKLVRRLMKVLTYCQSMSVAKEDLNFDNDPAVLISHPHGKCKCITIGTISDFIVPVGNDFPVDRPITFTKTAECRLPLLPWSEKSKSETFDQEEELCNSNSMDGKCDDLEIRKENVTPLPTPIRYPSDLEVYLEANGAFVINTGKNQTILSPGMFKRETENLVSAATGLESQNEQTSGAEVESSKKTNPSTSSHDATVQSRDQKDGETIVDDFEYFLDSHNFRCINMDSNDAFTLEDVYFGGNPSEPRDMRLDGLTKPPDAPEPRVPSKVGAQFMERVLNDVVEKTGFEPAATPAESQSGTAAAAEFAVVDLPDISSSSRVQIQTGGAVSASSDETTAINENSRHISMRSCGSTTLCDAGRTNEKEEGTELCSRDKVVEAQTSGTLASSTHEKEQTPNEEEEEGTELCSRDKVVEAQTSASISSSKHEKEQTPNEEEEEGTELCSRDKVVEAQTSASISSSKHEKEQTPNEEEEEGTELCCSSRESEAAAAVADLSIPEMLQMLVDKGINLFPDSQEEGEGEGSGGLSGVDALHELLTAMYHGDGVPLVSFLNKIYEDVATKNVKPVTTLEPGTQFNLVPGTTFTLPPNAKFALRFHDVSKSWFQFPPGTTFHTPEGENLGIPPDDAEFSFKTQAAVAGFMTYRLDSCPGSSGGLVLLGKGMWQSGSFSHSGQFHGGTRQNRSALRRWLIYLS